MRKFLILAFVIFSLTGYFTVSHVASCQAQVCTDPVACGDGGQCIEPNSLQQALLIIYSTIIAPDIAKATVLLTVYFAPLAEDVGDGMTPVMDWTFRELASWFDTFWYYSLQPDLQQMTAELSTANVEQAFSLGMFADATNMIRGQGRAFGGCDSGPAGVKAGCDTSVFGGDLGLKDHREERPSKNVCTGGSIMPALERATAFSEAFDTYAAAGKLWVAANDSNNQSAQGYGQYMCFRWQNNGTTCTTGGTFGYEPVWCNAAYNGSYPGCAASGTRPNNDVDVAGMVFAQDTIPLDTIQDPTNATKLDMDELVTNLGEAFVKDPVTSGTAGKDGLLASVSYKTKRQVVYDGLYYIISRRVPGGLRPASPGMPAAVGTLSNNTPATFVNLLKEMRAETNEETTTGCGTSACTSPDPSRNEVLRAMMTQRFQSGKYSLRQIDEPENNQREQVIEQALQLMQMSDQLDLMDHYSLLLASQVSTEITMLKTFTSAAAGAPNK